jgi:anti-anti-sigma factor
MMLRITAQRCGDVMVLSLRGCVSADSAVEIGNTLRSTLFRGYRKVLLNLELAIGSDTSAVGAFLEALLDARARGAELKIVNVGRRVTDLVIAAAFYFGVFDLEEDALDSFAVEFRTSARRRPAS